MDPCVDLDPPTSLVLGKSSRGLDEGQQREDTDEGAHGAAPLITNEALARLLLLVSAEDAPMTQIRKNRQQQEESRRSMRTISLGALIAAAYDVCGSAEEVAKVLESDTLKRKLRSKLQVVPA
ncbi:MAG: hypothetical protein QM723_39670 [Myxococcaceae bacterium]